MFVDALNLLSGQGAQAVNSYPAAEAHGGDLACGLHSVESDECDQCFADRFGIDVATDR